MAIDLNLMNHILYKANKLELILFKQTTKTQMDKRNRGETARVCVLLCVCGRMEKDGASMREREKSKENEIYHFMNHASDVLN